MANWKPISVKEALREIKDGEIVLPVIQRRLVWSEDKMELLFDSLLKGNSFGSIICIKEEKDTEPLFAYRDFTKDGSNLSSTEVKLLSKTLKFIIDGQQRLQSFYIGLQGSYNGKQMYYDLYSDYTEDEYDFKFALKPEDLPKNNKDRSNTAFTECLWYPVKNLFEKLNLSKKSSQVAKEIILDKGINDDDKKEIIKENISTFFSAIFADDNIGISEVHLDKTKQPNENRQRIVELFRRLNDGGTKLSSYDLVASMFKGFDYKMEQFLDTIVKDNEDIGINQDVLIKLLLILNDKPMKEMSDLSTEDAAFATSNRERIEITLKVLKKFLNVTATINWFSSNRKRSAIPLYFLAYHIFHSKVPTNELNDFFDTFDTNNKDFQSMKKWLMLSLLNKVFSKGCGWIPEKTGIRKLHKILGGNKGKEFPCTIVFETYRMHPLRFSTEINGANLDVFDRDFVLYLIYNGQPSIRREDIDHIHPQSLLRDNGVNEDQINSIGNFQLLDSGTNRGAKNGKELNKWINDNIAAENRQDYLRRHLIPDKSKLWTTDQFSQFLNTRLDMIAEKIKIIV